MDINCNWLLLILSVVAWISDCDLLFAFIFMAWLLLLATHNHALRLFL